MILLVVTCRLSYEAEIRGLTFQHWRGSRYETSIPRLLVLGESHYDDVPSGLPVHLLTNRIILDEIEGGHPGAFFSNIFATCQGRKPKLGRDDESVSDRREFWDAICYANYVQRLLPTPGYRSTRDDWASSIPALEPLLNALQPDLIMVLGRENWTNLPDLGR
jgi:hypothetical protein